MLMLPLASAGALDFGLVINQGAAISNNQGDEASQIRDGFEYRADIWPRISFLVGDIGEFLMSAGLTLGWRGDDFYYIPELLRTEISLRSGSWGLNAGRMLYSDPVGFVASGLFDGFRFSYSSWAGTFGAGAWYTGLLYKRNANIAMIATERAQYDTPVDYDSFVNTYFAPRRLLASFDWQHSSVADFLNLSAAVTAQGDFMNGDERYHSQYATVRAATPAGNFVLEFGASLEAAEFEPPIGDDRNFNLAYAFDFGLHWRLPTSFVSRLSLSGLITSGQTDYTAGVFVPVTNRLYGHILQARMTGICMFSLDYTARFARSLGTILSAAYFTRSDQETYKGYPVNIEKNSGHTLGTELFGRLVWSPTSDLQFNFGGGAFLPWMGHAGHDERINWRAELSAIMAIF
jgi:hypothetical protein